MLQHVGNADADLCAQLKCLAVTSRKLLKGMDGFPGDVSLENG